MLTPKFDYISVISLLLENRLNSLSSLILVEQSLIRSYARCVFFITWYQMGKIFNSNLDSQSDSSLATSEILREARQQVLDYCSASPKDYTCIFTSGATAALKLSAAIENLLKKHEHESSIEACLRTVTELAHNKFDTLGYALSQGATAFAVDVEDSVHHDIASRGQATAVKLSQHPAQRRNETKFLDSEPQGLRFSLDLVKLIKEDTESLLEGSPFCNGRWMVMIDAAKGCATQPPDLSKFPADFVVISFYKLFGYPTGLGALIVRNDAAKLLKKTYFSGGTVAASFADMDFVKRREGFEELFEDGTSSFLSIASIRHGFRILKSLTASAICQHTTSLTMHVKKTLLDLRHGNGASVCTLYGSDSSKVLCHESGPIVSFNLKRPDGSWFGYREVEKIASLSGIQLRTGCFCNPGACAKYLGLSHLDLLSNLEAGHICWDDNDIMHGKPTGAVRVSFGYMSTYEDAKKFIDFVRSSFVSIPNKSGNQIQLRTRPEIECLSMGCYLKSITIYPIKSCSGFSVESWPLCSTGLKHDREWLLRSLTGEILTQKKVQELCFISTSIDLNRGVMFVESPQCKTKLQINLNTGPHPGGIEEIELQSQRYEVEHYENDVNLWFSNAVGRPCTLLRCYSSNSHLCSNKNRNIGKCRDVLSRLNFPNEAQFLLVSEESISDLNNRLSSSLQKNILGPSIHVNPMRFRPNLVVSGGNPYAEDGWKSLKIGNNYFTSLGGCNRCQMINLVHQSGHVQKSNEPLATLASYRRVKGKILFGILLRYDMEENSETHANSWLQAGQEVRPDFE